MEKINCLSPISESSEMRKCKFWLKLFYGSESQEKTDFFHNISLEI